MPTTPNPLSLAQTLSFANLVWAADNVVALGRNVVTAVPVVNNVVDAALTSAGLPNVNTLLASPLGGIGSGTASSNAPFMIGGGATAPTIISNTAPSIPIPPRETEGGEITHILAPRMCTIETQTDDIVDHGTTQGNSPMTDLSRDDDADHQSRDEASASTTPSIVAAASDVTPTPASSYNLLSSYLPSAMSAYIPPMPTSLMEVPSVAIGTMSNIVSSAVGTSTDVLQRTAGIDAKPIVATLTPTAAAASALTVTALQSAIGTAMQVAEYVPTAIGNGGTTVAAAVTNSGAAVVDAVSTGSNAVVTAVSSRATAVPSTNTVATPTNNTTPTANISTTDANGQPTTLEKATAFVTLATNPKAALASDQHLRTIATVAGTVAAAAAVNALTVALTSQRGGGRVGGLLPPQNEAVRNTGSPALNNRLNFSPNTSHSAMTNLVASLCNGAFAPIMLSGMGVGANPPAAVSQTSPSQAAPLPPIVANPSAALTTAAGTVAMGALSALIASAVSQTVTTIGRSTRDGNTMPAPSASAAASSSSASSTTLGQVTSFLTYLPVQATSTALGAVATILPMVRRSSSTIATISSAPNNAVTNKSALATVSTASSPSAAPTPNGVVAIPARNLLSALLSPVFGPRGAPSSVNHTANAAAANNAGSNNAANTASASSPMLLLLPLVSDAVIAAITAATRASMNTAITSALRRCAVAGGMSASRAGPFICIITSVIEVGYNLLLVIRGEGVFLDVVRALLLAGGNVATLAAAGAAGSAGGGPVAAAVVAQVGVVVTTMALETIMAMVATRFGSSGAITMTRVPIHTNINGNNDVAASTRDDVPVVVDLEDDDAAASLNTDNGKGPRP